MNKKLNRQNLEKDEASITADLVKNISNDTLKSSSLSDLFPEFDFSGLLGLHKAYEALPKYLVMYDKIIVNLYPTDTDDKFYSIYGVSILELSKLIDLKKVQIVVCFPFELFDERYDVLFKKHCPRSSRTRDYLSPQSFKSKNHYLHQIKNMSWKGKDLDYAWEKYDSLDTFCLAFASDLFDLDMVGLHEIADIILTIGTQKPSYAHELAWDYCNLLARPMFECLGGVVTYNTQDRILAKQLYMKTDGVPLFNEKNWSMERAHNIENILGVHPSELIEFFQEELSVPDFSKISEIETFIEKIDQDTDVLQFRRMLLKIKSRYNTPTSLVEAGQVISDKIKRDAKLYGVASSVFKHAVYIGGSTAAITHIDQNMQKIALGTLIAGNSFGSAAEAIHKASETVFDKLAGTILKQPLISNFHKGRVS